MKKSTVSRNHRRANTKSAIKSSVQRHTRHAARKAAKTVRYN